MPYVHITLATGRSPEQKRALMAAVSQAVHDTIDAPIETVRAWITEIEPPDMSVGGVPLDEVRARRAAEAARLNGPPAA